MLEKIENKLAVNSEASVSEKDTPVQLSEKFDETYGTGIVGGKKIKPKQTNESRKSNTDSDSYIVSTLILEQAPNGEEFLTSKISEKYRNQFGKTTSSLSGQLYAKRQAGLLENRSANEHEVEIFGKVKIWKATDKFYDLMESIEKESAVLTEDKEVD